MSHVGHRYENTTTFLKKNLKINFIGSIWKIQMEAALLQIIQNPIKFHAKGLFCINNETILNVWKNYSLIAITFMLLCAFTAFICSFFFSHFIIADARHNIYVCDILFTVCANVLLKTSSWSSKLEQINRIQFFKRKFSIYLLMIDN